MRRFIGTGVASVVSLVFVALSACSATAPRVRPPQEAGRFASRGFLEPGRYADLAWSRETQQLEQAKSEARRRSIALLAESLDIPDVAGRGDLLFRLAELQWQEARYAYFLARFRYDASYACFRGRRCSQEPLEPKPDYTAAITDYRAALLADPDYAQRDDVFYALGRTALEMGQATRDKALQAEGARSLRIVIERFPESVHVPECHLVLAEHAFERDAFDDAEASYKAFLTVAPQHAMRDYALHQLAWVYFATDRFEQAVTAFQQVAAAGLHKTGAGTVAFRSEALDALMEVYAELAGGWRRALAYFEAELGEKEADRRLVQMTRILTDKYEYAEAIALYERLIARAPLAPDVVRYSDAVLELQRKIGDEEDVAAELDRVAERFAPDGAWTRANASNGALVKHARDLDATSLMVLANRYHREAQALEDAGRDGEVAYAKAAEYYATFLERYPQHPESYAIHFYYAEILYDFGYFLDAADQYERVLLKDHKGEYAEDAALGVVYAMLSEAREIPLVREGRLYVVQDADLKRDRRPWGAGLAGIEARFNHAADRYVEVLRVALKDPEFRQKHPHRGEKIPAMMYLAGRLYFVHGQYTEAVSRLMVIFDLYPEHPVVADAVELVTEAQDRLRSEQRQWR